MEKIVAATNNAGKLAEMRQILDGRFKVLSLADAGLTIEVAETGATFLENALIKAKAVYDRLKIPALADDSGLRVAYLNGAPGVFSARFSKAGDAAGNNRLLLERMKDAPDRSAEFVCAVVLYRGEGDYITGFGSTKGRILHAPEGGGGFGYDPLFYSDELKTTFAFAAPADKNRVSHRRRALEDLIAARKRER
jgi:XTP/dITP diphosphohydrolase